MSTHVWCSPIQFNYLIPTRQANVSLYDMNYKELCPHIQYIIWKDLKSMSFIQAKELHFKNVWSYDVYYFLLFCQNQIN